MPEAEMTPKLWLCCDYRHCSITAALIQLALIASQSVPGSSFLLPPGDESQFRPLHESLSFCSNMQGASFVQPVSPSLTLL